MFQGVGAVSGAGSSVDEEVKRVQAECRYLSTEIQRLREDNSRLRVSYALITSRSYTSHLYCSVLPSLSTLFVQPSC